MKIRAQLSIQEDERSSFQNIKPQIQFIEIYYTDVSSSSRNMIIVTYSKQKSDSYIFR